MFRIPREGDTGGPVFHTPPMSEIAWWRKMGWVLLIDERDVRRADLDDTREQDESRGRR